MPIADIHLAYLLLFGAMLLLVEGLYYLLREFRADARAGLNRRLRLLAADPDRAAVLGRLRRNGLDPVSAALSRIVPTTIAGFDRLIREAGVTLPVRRLLMICTGLAAVTLAILTLATTLPMARAVLLSGMAGFLLPMLWLRWRRHRRIQGLGAQLPEALEMMVRSLRAGHPIGAAINMVATEMPDPVGSEFGIVADEMTYGLDLDTALHNLTGRIPHPDLAFLIVAVQIQHKTGGNLSEVLANLAGVIRERFALKAKVQAITAQGRSGAFVIALMPLLTALAMNFLNRRYFGDVLDDPMFVPSMALAATFWVVGLAVIHKMVNFRV